MARTPSSSPADPSRSRLPHSGADTIECAADPATPALEPPPGRQRDGRLASPGAEPEADTGADAAIAERLLDLLEKAEREGRFAVAQGKLVRRIGRDFKISEKRLTDSIDRLVLAGVAARVPFRQGLMLHRGAANPERTTRAILHVLHGARQRGHAALPLGQLLGTAAKVLRSEESVVMDGLRALIAKDRLMAMAGGPEKVLIFTAAAYRAEQAVVDRLKELLRSSGLTVPTARRIRKFVRRAARSAKIVLNDGQAKAVASVVRSPVALITGAPGTGKTTVVRVVMGALARISRGRPILLAAPTGKAARRLSEATGRTAQTIHRLLRYSPSFGGFLHDRCNLLDAAAVIVDEASMIDVSLMANLLNAIPRRCRLVLVGDPDQLPPVAYGQPFADMIASGRFPVSRLSTILRQSEGSAIAAACQFIRDGRIPVMPLYPEAAELALVTVDGPASASVVSKIVEDAIRAGADPLKSLQVLTPTKSKAGGVHVLNEMLAPIANPLFDPAGTSCELFGGAGRRGDKVQQMRNDYEKGVVNGDQGQLLRISDLAFRGTEVVARFGTSEIIYTAAEAAAELALAYAITIHRAQGSEWDVVVVCLPPDARRMLTRNLLYTALSRGRRRVVVVGQKASIEQAVRTQGLERHGGLRERLIASLHHRNPIDK